MNTIILEWLGYLASIIVAVSLLMSSIVKLRWFNLIGSALFAAYGFAINALPVGIINLVIMIINIYYLYKIYTESEYFKLLEISKDSRYLGYFLEFYKKDISRFFPEFSFRLDNTEISFYVLRNLAVAGVFIGSKYDEETLQIDLDFVIPEYRDFKLGRYILIENEELFRKLGYKRLCSFSNTKEHDAYLRKMGFTETFEFGKAALLKVLV
ncbi:MAG: GNAT family N-acetyltransferase [Bacillota bacterium]